MDFGHDSLLELCVIRVSVVGVKSLHKEKTRSQLLAQTFSLTPPAIEISTPGKSWWDPPPPPLLPLDGFCLGERCYNLSSPSGVYPLLHGVLVLVHR